MMGIAFIQLSPVKVKAQDLHFSQFYNTPLLLNPALTGSFSGGFRLSTCYKNQWQSISPEPYRTFTFSGEKNFRLKLLNDYIGAGLTFFTDKAGLSQFGLNHINATCAFHKRFSPKNEITIGLLGGIAQQSVNFASLQWPSQYNGAGYDPTMPSNEVDPSNKLLGDFSGGVTWNYTKGGEMYATANNQFNVNLGVSFFHIIPPNQSVYPKKERVATTSGYSLTEDRSSIKIMMHGFTIIGFNNDKMAVVPSFMYVLQGPLQDRLVGASLRFLLADASKHTGFMKGAALSLGGHYRVGDAVLPAILLEIDQYALGISYDINTSNLTTASSGKGGIEISLRYISPLPKPIPTKTPRFFD